MAVLIKRTKTVQVPRSPKRKETAVPQAGRVSPGPGFSTMRKRPRLLGGPFEVKTVSGKGTEACVEIPVEDK